MSDNRGGDRHLRNPLTVRLPIDVEVRLRFEAKRLRMPVNRLVGQLLRYGLESTEYRCRTF